MNTELFIIDKEYVTSFYRRLDKVSIRLEALLSNYGLFLDGELYLSDRELAILLKVSRSTLFLYRSQGILPYIQLPGKVLYKQSDIQSLLEGNYLAANPSENTV